jgi:hypothetical protein
MLGRAFMSREVGVFAAIRGSSRRDDSMNAHPFAPALWALALCGLALPALAADRMRPGQWTASTVASGKTYASSTCVTPADAEAMNGDAKAVRTVLEKSVPPEVCKLSDVKPDGNRIVYKSACTGAAPTVVTTTYHGDSFESTTSTGVTSNGKLTGACK